MQKYLLTIKLPKIVDGVRNCATIIEEINAKEKVLLALGAEIHKVYPEISVDGVISVVNIISIDAPDAVDPTELGKRFNCNVFLKVYSV